MQPYITAHLNFDPYSYKVYNTKFDENSASDSQLPSCLQRDGGISSNKHSAGMIEIILDAEIGKNAGRSTQYKSEQTASLL